MDWGRFLFSPRGRINRAKYWGALAIQYGLGFIVWLPAIIFDDDGSKFFDDHLLYVVFALCATVALLVSHVFAQIKRFHDRDKPWPWIFIGFIPYIGGIWIFVECGLLEGTKGRNGYGPDPLGREADILKVFGPDEPATLPPQNL